ncbi:MAG: tetratricopeptide repeat protein [Flavobacteriaceae bacterium]
MTKQRNILLLSVLCTSWVMAQRNCNVYKWAGDDCRYKACIYLENAPRHFQLTKEFHAVHDEALALCPEYSDAYRAKSVAYLKTGDFIQWKKLMDQAVTISPKDHLGYRGWCRFQFVRDYKGALQDLEHLVALLNHDIAYSQNGMYHLTVTRALCHKMLGERDKAIALLTNFLSGHKDDVGLYDYLHLGVLYLESGDYNEALNAFSMQEKVYDLAENAYYTAMAHKGRNDVENARIHLQRAQKHYRDQRFMFDPYTHQVDKIYLTDIQTAIDQLDQVIR